MKPLRPIVDEHGHSAFDRRLLEKGVSPVAYRAPETIGSRCLFCDEVDGERSKEHIVGDKLSEYLGIRTSVTRLAYTNGFDELDVLQASHNNLVSSNVCMKCNNGWMSQIDDAFLSQVKGEWDLRTPAVAEWVVKTSMTANAGYNMRRMIPRDVRLTFADPALRWPMSVSVFLFRASDTGMPFDYFSSLGGRPPDGFPTMLYETEECREYYSGLLEKVYVCGWRVNDLIAVAVFNEHQDECAIVPSAHKWGRLAVSHGKHRPLDFSSLPEVSDLREAMAFLIVLKSSCTWMFTDYRRQDDPERAERYRTTLPLKGISPKFRLRSVEMGADDLREYLTPSDVG